MQFNNETFVGLKFKLKNADRNYLRQFIKAGKRSSIELNHAYVLLALDNGKTQEDIMGFYQVSRTTIWRIKSKYYERGLEDALIKGLQKGKPKKYEKRDEDELVKLANLVPPYGKNRWTIQLLIETLVNGNSLKKMNRETIRQLLKKREINIRR